AAVDLEPVVGGGREDTQEHRAAGYYSSGAIHEQLIARTLFAHREVIVNLPQRSRIGHYHLVIAAKIFATHFARDAPHHSAITHDQSAGTAVVTKDESSIAPHGSRPCP